MRREIIIVDNFYQEPENVIRYARSLKYCAPFNKPGDTKTLWRSSWFKEAQDCPFKSSAAFIAKLEHLTGETLDREHWNLTHPVGPDGVPTDERFKKPRSCWWNCTFHEKHYDKQELGQ